jgi:hypothetical protein
MVIAAPSGSPDGPIVDLVELHRHRSASKSAAAADRSPRSVSSYEVLQEALDRPRPLPPHQAESRLERDGSEATITHIK